MLIQKELFIQPKMWEPKKQMKILYDAIKKHEDEA